MSSKCILCDKNLKNSKISNVQEAGLQSLIEISFQRGDQRLHDIFRSVNSIKLHLACRNRYSIETIATSILESVNNGVANENGVEIVEMTVSEVTNVEEPPLNHRNIAFEKTCLYMKQTDECEFTLMGLMDKMKSFLPPCIEVYPKRYFLEKIEKKFGDEIIIVNAKGIGNFICFKDKLNKVLTSKTSPKSEEDSLLAAAKILQRDIGSLAFETKEYPSFQNIISGGVDNIPPKLTTFMNMLLEQRIQSPAHQIKSLAIQNTLISLMRPRFISPLLIGIGTLVHRRTNSRYIIDVLNAYGFSSSYNEIMKMQKCAAVEPQRKKMENAYIQHIWDNADINTRTLNGKGTWHSLGGLECVTPATCAIVSGNLSRTTDKLSAKEVGKFGCLPIKSYMKPKESGLRTMKVETIVIAECADNIRQYLITDCLWLCGRLLNLHFAPSWFGYNDHITKETSGFVQTKTTPLPFINLDPGNLSTLFTALHFVASQCKQLDQKIGFVTFDQPLYIKAVNIAKSASPSSEISNLIIRLGGFHLLMSFLGAMGFIMNGSGIEELYSTVYAKNTITHMLSGHAYSRSLRACFFAQEAISHLVLQNQIEFTDEEKLYIQGIFETIDDSDVEKNLDDPLLNIIASTLNTKFNKLKFQSRTSMLWIQFWKMVQIVKDYIKAERIGDWNMHLLCVRKMIPYFHATGRLQYAKCCQIYLQDMINLKNVMPPNEFSKFVTDGFFTIRRTSKLFAGTWTDMVIEQDLMRAIKVSGGLNHGRGTTDHSLAIWMGALPYCTEIINCVEKFCGKSYATSEQHVELRTSREKIDRTDFNKFKEWLKEHDPFDETKTELYSISTGVVASSIINCDQAEKIGLDCIKEIIGKNFDELKLSLKAKIKPIGFSKNSMKLNGQDVIINPNQLFHRMLTFMPNEEKLRDSFNYELSSYPLSFFDSNGMRGTDASSLFSYFDRLQGKMNVQFTQNNSEFFVCGDVLLRKVVWNVSQTFGEIIDEYVKCILYYYGRTNVSIIFNGSNQSCLTTPASPEVLFESHTKVAVKQSQFLKNNKNKIKIADCLIKRLFVENIRAYQAEKKSDRMITKVAIAAADKHNTKNIVVVSDNIDVLVLLIDQATTKNVFMQRQSTKMCKTSNVAVIQEKLGYAKDNILTIHALSGTMMIPSFYKKGKITFLKKVMTNISISRSIRIFNEQNADVRKLYNAGEKLLLNVYGATNKTKDINSLRYELFNKINRKMKLNKVFELASLPPTTQTAQQQFLRTYFQVQEWKYNTFNNQTDWGWTLEEGVLFPTKTSITMVIPNWLSQTIFCKCKSGCKSKILCSCKKFEMPCSEACGNCHAECCNKINCDITDNIDTIYE